MPIPAIFQLFHWRTSDITQAPVKPSRFDALAMEGTSQMADMNSEALSAMMGELIEARSDLANCVMTAEALSHLSALTIEARSTMIDVEMEAT